MYSVPWDIYTTKHIPKDEDTVDIEMVDLKDATEYQVRVVLVAVDFNSYQGEDLPVAKGHTKCESMYCFRSCCLYLLKSMYNLNCFYQI